MSAFQCFNAGNKIKLLFKCLVSVSLRIPKLCESINAGSKFGQHLNKGNIYLCGYKRDRFTYTDTVTDLPQSFGNLN